MEIFSKVFEIAAKYAWAAFVVAAFVLFVPEDALDQLGLKEIKTEYKGYFWLALVFTGTLSIGAVFSYFDKKVFDDWLSRRRAEKAHKRERKRQLSAVTARLASLSDREKIWIQYCLFHNVQTLSSEMNDVTAQSLLNKKILSQGSGNMLNLPFHIPDDLWSYLQDNRPMYLSPEEEEDPQFAKMLERFRESLYPDHWMAT